MRHSAHPFRRSVYTLALLLPFTAAAAGELYRDTSTRNLDSKQALSGLQGKRFMDSAAVVMKAWQEEQGAEDTSPIIVDKPLTAEDFPAFFNKYLKGLYALGPDGKLIQVAQWNEQGKLKKLRAVPKGSKRVTAESFLANAYDGMTFTVTKQSERSCTFCDGLRYVIYFPEEVRAAQENQKRNHGTHDGSKRKRGAISYYDSGETADKQALEARATHYGWQNEWGTSYGLYACCWTKLHESSLQSYRHFCPICKGKEKETLIRRYTYQLSLPGRVMPIEALDAR